MPYFKTSSEWFDQSSLLLKARPATTRITSKYTVLKPTASKIKKRKRYAEKLASRPAPERTGSPPPALRDPEEVTATFTLKTYEPESGTCLQYQTNKVAEVGRLIGSLGKLGRHMAALPEVTDDLSQPAGGADGVSTPRVEEDVKMSGTAPSEPKASGGGGGKKKKKGKK